MAKQSNPRLTRQQGVLICASAFCYAVGYPLALIGGFFAGWILVTVGGVFLLWLGATVVTRLTRAPNASPGSPGGVGSD